jgi:ferrochelatase
MLLNFGGPQSLDEVKPFLKEIFSDRNVMGVLQSIATSVFFKPILKASINKYELIGGSSPLVEITKNQAAELQEELGRRNYPVTVYPGMRYSKPYIKDALSRAISEDAGQLIVLPLYPQYSLTTTHSTFRELDRVLKEYDKSVATSLITSYESHPSYINALTDRLHRELQEAGPGTKIVFSAHSLPRRLWEKDSRYIEGIKKTAHLVAQTAGIKDYELAYQSGRKGWLGPTVEEKLRELAQKDCKSVVVVPLSFTCDNIETLYDIDIKLKAEADRLGMELYRMESLNDSPLFISALADIVIEKISGNCE